jgi:hypothetical protein
MGYEQRESGVFFNWDLRVAFEHENSPNWQDELCKLCHVVADLRVLVAYIAQPAMIESLLQNRIELMGERCQRVRDSQWLFIFGPESSKRNRLPWVAYTLDRACRLTKSHDDNPFCPYIEFARRDHD